MSIVEKFEVSNLDILRVILDVLIVNKVEGINDKNNFTESILLFKYIIYLYLTNINEFITKFKPTYDELIKNKKLHYTSIISVQKILIDLKFLLDKNIQIKTYLNKTPNPFKSLNMYTEFKGLDINIDTFFIDKLKDLKDTDVRKMKKRGLVYFIKFTQYIILLNHIMETEIDEKNIEKLKGYIKTYAPDIRNINTFSSFTEKTKKEEPSKKQPENIKGQAVSQTIGLAVHIDANAAEYIKLNKLIFDLEKKSCC